MDEQQVPQSAPVRPVGPIIGIVVAVLLLGGIALVASMKKTPEAVIQQPPGTVEKTQEQVSADQERQQAQTLDTAREAIATGNDDACSRLPAGQEQVTCRAYATIAKAQAAGDAKLCIEITDEYWNTNCKDQVLTYRAVSMQNPNLCDQLIVKERIPSCRAQAAPKE